MVDWLCSKFIDVICRWYRWWC